MAFSDVIIHSSFFCMFGIITVIALIFETLNKSYKFYVTHFLDSSVDFAKFGKWAIVTGSTDGIGKAIAHELAKRRINIFLISRNLEKLTKVAEEIERAYKVETKILVFDFTNFDHSPGSGDPYNVISEAIKDLDVGIMVNNVGMPTGGVDVFHKSQKPGETLSKTISNLIHCNASSRVKMMELVLPSMIARKIGLIINISSMSAAFACPVLNTYAATKRFDDTLSVSLGQEYRKHGVIIQSIQPGFVQTNMTKPLGSSTNLIFPTATTYVHHMMKTIGKSDCTNGYWAHTISLWLTMLIPEDIPARAMFKNFMKIGKRLKS
uniref:very-long-chain 3-oxoacyl-CoA reductase-A-like n=1 Tax=Styela clava TaxID=7725 RepID=UPI00193A7526|nr:very-long-chain 3-oxoacyl-CoA reductase-A-like [Styela clava]